MREGRSHPARGHRSDKLPAMNPQDPLLRHLADGRFHSGQDLASACGISRAAVWKRLQQLRGLPGMELQAVRGRGYRLGTPLELLDHEHLTAALGPAAGHLQGLAVLAQVPSTNAWLLERPAPLPGSGSACLAEHQTAGRGRRGRRWVSGYGRNLALSLSWTFDLPMAAVSGISLAAGVALAGALAEVGVQGHGLKWPNDVFLEGRKLAGILVEAGGETAGPTRVVIGIGINLQVDETSATAIDQPWADLREQLGPCPPRNRIAGRVLAGLVSACLRYQQHGLAPFLDQWASHDLHLGQQVVLRQGDRTITGIHAGLAEDGRLLLDTRDGRRAFAGGEVSLRPGEDG